MVFRASSIGMGGLLDGVQLSGFSFALVFASVLVGMAGVDLFIHFIAGILVWGRGTVLFLHSSPC